MSIERDDRTVSAAVADVAKVWWVVLVVGVIFLGFGIVMLFNVAAGATAIAIIVGAFLIFDGITYGKGASVLKQLAKYIGRDAFRAMHDRLLRAYFVESRDITNGYTLRALWRDVGLDEAAFAASAAPATTEAVIADHRDAIAHGVNGVPAIMMIGNDVPVVGAMPFESYRRWIARALAAV